MRYLFGFLMALAVFAFAACGGDECADPVADVTGEWKIDATPITDTCGGSLAPYTFFITATQEGNALTSETPEGTMIGTICGDQMRMSLRSTEGGGTATVDMELTVYLDGNSAEGSDTWRWTSGAQSCGGSESLSATRVDGHCAEPVDVAGEWQMTSTVVSDNCDGREDQTFPMTITRDGNALTAETPELTFTGTICGNQIQMKGSFPEDDGTVTVNATLNVSAEGDSMQGSDTWTWTDGSESCSGSGSLSAISNGAPVYDACHNVENCVQSADLCEELSVDFAGFTYVNAICTLTCETEGPLSSDCPRALVGRSGSCYPSSVAGGITDALICFEPCDFLEDCQVGFRCFGALDLCGADFTSCPIDENDTICAPGPS